MTPTLDAPRSLARAAAIAGAMAFGLSPGWARSAPAQSEEFSVVSDLSLAGDTIDEHWRREFDDALTRGLERAGFSQVSPTEECVDARCLRQQAREAGATAVVRASVVVRDRFYTVRLEAFDPSAADGSTPPSAAVEEECPICGPGEVSALLERTATVLARKLPKHEAPGQLMVRSVPVGATVVVDGKTAGVSPLDVDLEPGQHRLVVTAPGYVAQERATTSVSSVRETWAPVLRKLEPPPTPQQRRLAIAGWSTTGAGAAAGVAAIVFLALDRRPFPSSCGAAMLDADGDCGRVYRTLPHAGITLGATALLVVTGALLLSRSRRAKPNGARARRRRAGTLVQTPPQPSAGIRW